GLQDGLTSSLGGDEFLVEGVTGLGDRFGDSQTVEVARAALASHDDVAYFRDLGAGRLGRSGAGHKEAAHQGGRRPEQLFAVSHRSVSPLMKALRHARQAVAPVEMGWALRVLREGWATVV